MRYEHLFPLLKKINIEIDRGPTPQGWIICHCPFAPFHPAHASGRDESASFCVKVNNENRSGFNCFTCKHKGSIMDLMAFLGHYTKQTEKYMQLGVEASLKERYAGSNREFDTKPRGTIKPKPISDKMYQGMYPPAWQALSSRTYLKARGIGEQTAEMLGILYEPKERRVAFPIRDRQQRLYGFTGRTILKKEAWPKIAYGKVKDWGFDDEADGGKQFFILGAHLVDCTRPILVVEGLMALAHMLELGVDEFVQPVATMGSVMSDFQASLLEEWGMPVYMLYDKDGAGRLGLDGFIAPGPKGTYSPGALRKLWNRVPTYEMLYPNGFTDPDKLNFQQIKLMHKYAKRIAF